MTIDEIFIKLRAHMEEGICMHKQMVEIFAFMELSGYKECQYYHYLCEDQEYQQLYDYYIKHYHKLLPKEKQEEMKLIPDSWYKYTTFAVDTGTKRSTINDMIKNWIEWEKKTKNLYQTMYKELQAIDEIDASIFLQSYIEDVSAELADAEQLQIELETINYNLELIIPDQNKLYKKFHKKIKQMVVR